MFGLEEKTSGNKTLLNKNVTLPNSKNDTTQSTQISISDDEVKKLDAVYSSWGDTVHYSKNPKVFRGCEGSYMYDANDTPFLDLQMMYSAANFGYRNQRITNAVIDQMNTMPQLTPKFLQPYKSLLSEKMEKMIEARFHEKGRMHFNVGGAQANEDAIKVVRNYTKRNGLFAFQGGYHGRTIAATCITSSFRYREKYGHSEQLVDEINAIIDFVADTMAIFKMEFEVELSTRPESYVGEIENWNKAEAGLKEAMERRGMKYDINEGDGAFYGPKIDFKVKDAIGRTWQCATIQLDFNLPARFDIKYQDKDGQLKTPLMLHRVIFGSMERFHGILIEHYAGAFPCWLAPTQVSIVPISNEKHVDFAEEVYKKMRNAGIRVQLDDRSESMNYKIRESLQDKKVPYVCVIGDKEIEANSVAVRKRGVG